ncbi:acyltransferase [Paraglaciecola sp. L1A13]|uniref:acyltransferase family protein n=1 Tax=Paraglaciecola sp. L1A13 TaxID=2686359 RepID=UPI00131C35D1|nr:acyltransferase [Paraglaciecola sp. L1A13]
MQTLKKQLSERHAWLDLAKGLGICLVVMYHTCEGILNSFQHDTETVLALTNFFRSWLMPMFFMVSGMLIRRSINEKSVQANKSKLLDWAYIYVVWSIIIYLVRLLSNSLTNTNMAANEILFILWDPVPTIWFIYALALSHAVTLLLRNQPPTLVLSAALIINLVNGAFFGWFEGSIFERFGWIYLFYALGFYKGNELIGIIKSQKLSLLGPIFFIGFGFLLALYRGEFHPFSKPFISVAMSLAFLIMCYRVELLLKNNVFFKFWVYIGSISLFIYLTHFAFPAATRMVLLKLGLYSFTANILAAVVLAMIIGFIASKLSKTQPVKLLFNRPQLKNKME